MWSVVEQDSEYVITDHNGDERGRLPTGDGISTQDVSDVMRERAATLKQETATAARNENVEAALTTMTEWATIIEEMAGEQIEFPESDQ